MAKDKQIQDLSRAVGGHEAAGVRGGDGKTVTKKKGKEPEVLIQVKLEDLLIS